MDFGKALEALKEGKTLTNPCMDGFEINLLLKINRDSNTEEEYILRVRNGDVIKDYTYIPLDWLLSDKWEIIENENYFLCLDIV